MQADTSIESLREQNEKLKQKISFLERDKESIISQYETKILMLMETMKTHAEPLSQIQTNLHIYSPTKKLQFHYQLENENNQYKLASPIKTNKWEYLKEIIKTDNQKKLEEALDIGFDPNHSFNTHNHSIFVI